MKHFPKTLKPSASCLMTPEMVAASLNNLFAQHQKAVSNDKDATASDNHLIKVNTKFDDVSHFFDIPTQAKAILEQYYYAPDSTEYASTKAKDLPQIYTLTVYSSSDRKSALVSVAIRQEERTTKYVGLLFSYSLDATYECFTLSEVTVAVSDFSGTYFGEWLTPTIKAFGMTEIAEGNARDLLSKMFTDYHFSVTGDLPPVQKEYFGNFYTKPKKEEMTHLEGMSNEDIEGYAKTMMTVDTAQELESSLITQVFALAPEGATSPSIKLHYKAGYTVSATGLRHKYQHGKLQPDYLPFALESLMFRAFIYAGESAQMNSNEVSNMRELLKRSVNFSYHDEEGTKAFQMVFILPPEHPDNPLEGVLAGKYFTMVLSVHTPSETEFFVGVYTEHTNTIQSHQLAKLIPNLNIGESSPVTVTAGMSTGEIKEFTEVIAALFSCWQEYLQNHSLALSPDDESDDEDELYANSEDGGCYIDIDDAVDLQINGTYLEDALDAFDFETYGDLEHYKQKVRDFVEFWVTYDKKAAQDAQKAEIEAKNAKNRSNVTRKLQGMKESEFSKTPELPENTVKLNLEELGIVVSGGKVVLKSAGKLSDDGKMMVFDCEKAKDNFVKANIEPKKDDQQPLDGDFFLEKAKELHQKLSQDSRMVSGIEMDETVYHEAQLSDRLAKISSEGAKVFSLAPWFDYVEFKVLSAPQRNEYVEVYDEEGEGGWVMCQVTHVFGDSEVRATETVLEGIARKYCRMLNTFPLLSKPSIRPANYSEWLLNHNAKRKVIMCTTPNQVLGSGIRWEEVGKEPTLFPPIKTEERSICTGNYNLTISDQQVGWSDGEYEYWIEIDRAISPWQLHWYYELKNFIQGSAMNAYTPDEKAKVLEEIKVFVKEKDLTKYVFNQKRQDANKEQ